MAGKAHLPPLTLNARFRWAVINQIVGKHRPVSVLEVGCGRGAVGARLARQAAYVGVEPDSISRMAAQKVLEGVPGARIVEYVEDVSDDRRFDMVCAFEVLEHLECDTDALAGWVRRKSPNGFVLFSVPAHRKRFGAADRRVGHLRRYDRSDLETLVRLAGLRIDRVWSTGWPMGLLLEAAWNVVAAIKPRDGSAAERSAESGRWFQPQRALTPVMDLLSVPGLWLQKMRFDGGAGTGWVVLCR